MTEPREPYPAVTFVVTPDRIGRHHKPEPFEVNLPQHYRGTADLLASRIFKHVRPYLMSKEYEVAVDLAKMKFSIDAGRFGRGVIKEKVD